MKNREERVVELWYDDCSIKKGFCVEIDGMTKVFKHYVLARFYAISESERLGLPFKSSVINLED